MTIRFPVRVASAIMAAAALAATPVFAKEKFDEAGYKAAIAKAENGDADVDYGWLRKQATVASGFFGSNWETRQKAEELYQQEPDKALALAKARMAQDWTDFLPHMMAAHIHRTLEQPAEAERQNRIAMGLLRSITGGHKGTSAEDAFNAVNVPEEYRILMTMGLIPERQALVPKDGHNFDVFTIKAREGKPAREVWFNIDAFFGKQF